MKTYQDLIDAALPHIRELMPWEAETLLDDASDTLVLDVREPAEYQCFKIAQSLNVPRGVLEQATEEHFDESEPELINGRQRPILVVCRSGNRSVLAAFTLKLLGFEKVYSMKTGIKGWNDFDLPLQDATGQIMDGDDVDQFLSKTS